VSGHSNIAYKLSANCKDGDFTVLADAIKTALKVS